MRKGRSEVVNYKWFSQMTWIRGSHLAQGGIPDSNESFSSKKNILINFFLGITRITVVRNIFSNPTWFSFRNLNKSKFIPWESFCFSWMFWKLILQKRAWVNKTEMRVFNVDRCKQQNRYCVDSSWSEHN